jgi:hypothetical protein
MGERSFDSCQPTSMEGRGVFITSLTFEDFGPFEERTVVPCAPITLFFGENGAGKSAILNALLLLKQSCDSPPEDESPLRLTGPDVTYGSGRSLFFRYDPQRTARVGVHSWVHEDDYEWHEHAFSARDAGCFQGQEYALRLSSHDTADGLSVVSISQFLGEEREELFRLQPAATTSGIIGNVFPAGRLKPGSRHFEVDPGTINCASSILQRDVTYLRGLRGAIDKKVRQALSGKAVRFGKPEEEFDVGAYVARVADAVGADFWPAFLGRLKSYDVSALIEDMEDVSPHNLTLSAFYPDYHPLSESALRGLDVFSNGMALHQFVDALEYDRAPVLRSLTDVALATSFSVVRMLGGIVKVGPARALPSRVMTLQELREGPLASSVGRLVSSSETLEHVNKWAGYLGIGYTLKVQRFDIAGVQDSFVLIAHDEKTGVDCTLQDVGYGVSQLLPVLTASIGGNGSLVIIQQPELHLHPRLQSRVADVFVNGVQQGNQLLIETHSEHIVYRLQRLIREGRVSPSDVAINWIYRDRDGSHCHPIRLDDEGDFMDEWPGGFFEDGFDDIIAGVDI